MGDSFKNGSGNLDFGSNDEPEEDSEAEKKGDNEQVQSEPTGKVEATQAKTETERESDVQDSELVDANGADSGRKYPYFVRRSKVGDERDNRLEVFARDKVVSQESEFRNKLADQLGTDSVAKTDAREYALITAFKNVEEVADRMREDGYGELE